GSAGGSPVHRPTPGSRPRRRRRGHRSSVLGNPKSIAAKKTPTPQPRAREKQRRPIADWMIRLRPLAFREAVYCPVRALVLSTDVRLQLEAGIMDIFRG